MIRNFLQYHSNLGYKGSLYEGGVRVPAFIHSALLTNSGVVSEAMTHVTDWYPTFLRLAGESKEVVAGLGLDGVDQYDTFFGSAANSEDRYAYIISRILMHLD